ncbi:hypothetical protein [Pseudomonas sp. NPDC099000]|uniref:hypothetical protein n=1 Tax=Pseudomonas sp. NPDC099000 TaxID=3364488 RepID=UPI00383AA7E5
MDDTIKKTSTPFKSSGSPELEAPTTPQFSGTTLKLADIGEYLELGIQYKGQVPGQFAMAYINVINDKGKTDSWYGGINIKDDKVNIKKFPATDVFEIISNKGNAELLYTVKFGEIEKESYSLKLSVER